MELPPLALPDWQPTKDTLHLWLQIIGKVKLASTQPLHHWWNVTFRVAPWGLTTGRMRHEGIDFQVDVDMVGHQVVVRTPSARAAVDLRDGLSVAGFYTAFTGCLETLGVRPEIKADPFGVPMTTPFEADEEHHQYDVTYVERYRQVLAEVSWVFEEFAGWYRGKSSPVHLFWHSMDLAVTRFSGRRADPPPPPEADRVTQHAYSDEVISFGFWAGDQKITEPAFYSYTAPAPAGLEDQPLEPPAAFWAGAGGMALYHYDDMRAEADPRTALLGFLQSAYTAGVRAAGWDYPDLDSAWCPDAYQLGKPA